MTTSELSLIDPQRPGRIVLRGDGEISVPAICVIEFREGLGYREDEDEVNECFVPAEEDFNL